ncbi:MAG TPA: YigZ family protein [Sulfurimonas sp.]|nr:YigZ family protein [Sulfurimonas sp.]
MKFIDEHIFHTLEVKQSKFIAHLMPYPLYAEVLKKLKQDNPKARHFVVASRYINEYDQIVEHCSDDGEPKGTSGKPTLAVLAGNGLINSAVIIVRYFGGTKLGTGGLVRAYSDACNGVIQKSKLSPYVKLEAYGFKVKYTDISLIEYALLQDNIDVKEKAFDELGAKFIILSEKSLWEKFCEDNERSIQVCKV